MAQVTLPFLSFTDEEVRAALLKYAIGLTVDEARSVETMLGRPPTVTEAVIWGIQGSEHCSYKSSRRFLKLFPTTGKHVILGPKEDSGIIAITDGPKGKRWGVVVSHESHNKPSQVVPYEGAATGVGGCVRDVACMGARVIGVLDSLRLGDLQSDETRAIASEVIRGIAGYGNPLGIPNLGGDTVFDSSHNKMCLVNVVTVGIVREDEIIHSYVQEEAAKEKYDIVMVGKATDRSGFGGAAFASVTLQEKDKEKNAGAVQEPNPFLERHLLASTYALFDRLAREKKLNKVSFKDLGAGGNVCASVEQVASRGFGARVDLDAIHVAIQGLPPEVIACAETQERFCWICHPDLTEMILTHYNETWDLPSVAEGARASKVGTVTGDGIYELRSKGEIVCSAKSTDITSGLQYTRPTKAPELVFVEPAITCSNDCVSIGKKSFTLQQVFEAMIAHPSYASKSRVFRHYDKNILGNTVIEPGEADASVIQPLADIVRYSADELRTDWAKDLSESDGKIGVALASGGNGRYGRISPYLQGVNAVVEQMRNIACVGALPRAITDCLNYGNPEIPEHLYALEEGIRGIADAAKGLAFDGEPIPVISGNVSLYNAKPEGPVDPTAVVCIVGVMPDATKARHGSFKKFDSILYLLGSIENECGGSAYYRILEELSDAKRDALLGKNVPSPNLSKAMRNATFVASAVREGIVVTAHDVSEGGLALALFEMTPPVRGIGDDIGFDVDLDQMQSDLRSDTLLFSETGVIVLEVDPRSAKTFQSSAEKAGCRVRAIGRTIPGQSAVINRGEKRLLSLDLSALRTMWSEALPKALRSL